MSSDLQSRDQPLHPSAQRVANAARELGLEVEVVEFPQTTRMAGTPFAVFAITPAELLRACQGTTADLKVV
ncbi:MAG: hypothetical protein L0332_23700 [Chloroflexi bacterium]|nr:hypothetical protein [Chloroflexota bacterium]MCI0577205.1 hypothetical protein [Chloroflexota bacterium]MCI0649085.1 hypothetical protein [Chloroflexota bacterium]MCI0729698.1 hypothetical protein [Chloroflexota bacterium]